MAGTFNPGGLNTPPTSIVNVYSAGGVGAGSLTSDYASYPQYGLKVTLSGALTATTYKEIVAVTDSGVLKDAIVQCVDATERTFGIKLIVDGVTIFDASCSACTTAYAAVIAVGGYGMSDNIPFNSSLSILVKSSLSETNKLQLIYKYVTT